MPTKIIINPQDIERIVAANPAPASNALAYFASRPCKNTCYAAVRDIQEQTGNIPVIRRGDAGYRPKASASVAVIEPMPIEIDDSFTAVELDDYERSTAQGRQQMIDDKLQQHLKIIRNTTRALAIQAHTGKIDYMMQSGGSLVRYEVDFGKVGAIASNVSMAALTIADLITSMNDAIDSMAAENVGGPVEFIASRDLFTAIVNAAANQKAYAISAAPGSITIGGFTVLMDNDSYTDVVSGAKKTKGMLDKKQLLARATQAGQMMPYYKIDDVIMRQAVPFYSFAKDREDQRGVNIYTKSKPLPLINPKGIVITTFKA